MSKVRLCDKRRAFCRDTLEIPTRVVSPSQGHREAVSGLAWKAAGLAKLGFKHHPALQGVPGGMVEVLRGLVLCRAVKCGVEALKPRAGCSVVVPGDGVCFH